MSLGNGESNWKEVLVRYRILVNWKLAKAAWRVHISAKGETCYETGLARWVQVA